MTDEMVPIPKLEVKPKVPQPLLSTLKWSEYDGPLPYIYQNRAKGHKCAWSVRWQAGTELGGNVCVEPAWWFPRGTPGEYLKYEFDDVLARGGQHLTPQDIEFIKNFDPSNNDQLTEAQELARRMRPRYPEYIFTTNRPSNIMVFRRRPGW